MLKQVSFLSEDLADGKSEAALYLKDLVMKPPKDSKPKLRGNRKDTSADDTGDEIALVRTIFYRYVTQAFNKMAMTGQMEGGEFEVALLLEHAASTAADNPEKPLHDLKVRATVQP